MDRLLVVRCPELLGEDEDGDALRAFATVVAAVGTYCPWVTPVRPGVCSIPARGPARYFGGETALVALVRDTVATVTPAEVGVADGLAAAVLAASEGGVVPAGGTAAFLAPRPVTTLAGPDLAGLLGRLGIRTLGQFAALPEAHVLGRFGAAGALCHRVAAGRDGEAGDLREPRTAGVLDQLRQDRPREAGYDGGPSGAGFWGGASDADVRAARSLAAVQELLGPAAVLTARLQGGRDPAARARFVTWAGGRPARETASTAPWPGRIPPPAPAVVHPTPLHAELADGRGEPARVSARGLLTTTPARLSVDGGPWAELAAWAGPWPSEERWWSRSRRRGARLQVVTDAAAHLLVTERGRWRVEATYG